MVAGHLQEKKGYFYMVLTYRDHEGKRKSKWISTKLPVKGNKKRAQEMLRETRKTFEPDRHLGDRLALRLRPPLPTHRPADAARHGSPATRACSAPVHSK